MDIKKWLGQKLEDSWSPHRLSSLLNSDILTSIEHERTELDSTSMCRVLLSLLHLRPAQVREMHNEIEALLHRCLDHSGNTNEMDWVQFVARCLKGFTHNRCIDDNIQHQPEIHEQVKSMIHIATDTYDKQQGIPLYMHPHEAQYLDASLCPRLNIDHCDAHFKVVTPLTFQPEVPKNTDDTSSLMTSIIPVTSTTAPLAPARTSTPLTSVRSSAPLISSPLESAHTIAPLASARTSSLFAPARSLSSASSHSSFVDSLARSPTKSYRLGPVQPFQRKIGIKKMGLDDAQQLQDRIRRRQRPSEQEIVQRKKDKDEQKKLERVEREQKRVEERDAKRRKKMEEKETKRVEREAVRELRLREAANVAQLRAQQRELERRKETLHQSAKGALSEAITVATTNPNTQLHAPATFSQAQVRHDLHAPQQISNLNLQPQRQIVTAAANALPINTSGSATQAVIASIATNGTGAFSSTANIPHSQVHLAQAALPTHQMHAPAQLMGQFQHQQIQQQQLQRQQQAILQQRQMLAVQQHQQQQQQQQKAQLQALFSGANKLTVEHQQLIESFLAGQSVSHPDAQNGIFQVTMSETRGVDNNSEYLEIIVFEMNFNQGSWRKLKRRRRAGPRAE